jgi:hypothetical protein
MTVKCPHCGAANPAGSAFCESCGKALPAAASSGPRVVSADQLPQSAGATRMVSDELVKQQKKAANAMLTVAIIQVFFGIVLYLLLKNAPGVKANPGQLNLVVGMVMGIGVIYFGLYFWARKSPLPAAIVGLVLYVTLMVVDVISDPAAMTRGIIVKIIIIALLAQGIQAGLKHKRLLQAGAVA